MDQLKDDGNARGPLVVRAAARTAEPALIQNGNEAKSFDTKPMATQEPLAVRASSRTAEPALIQNGSDPGTFATKAKPA